jgi:hypothetical protein
MPENPKVISGSMVNSDEGKEEERSHVDCTIDKNEQTDAASELVEGDERIGILSTAFI